MDDAQDISIAVMALTMSARDTLQLSMGRHDTYAEAFTASSQHHYSPVGLQTTTKTCLRHPAVSVPWWEEWKRGISISSVMGELEARRIAEEVEIPSRVYALLEQCLVDYKSYSTALGRAGTLRSAIFPSADTDPPIYGGKRHHSQEPCGTLLP